MSSHLPDGFLPDGHIPTGYIPEASEGSGSPSTVDVRQRFAAPYPFFADAARDFYTFRPVVKDPSEQLKVELDFFLWCANFWRPNESTIDQEHFYPPRATGLIYRSGGGRTGIREPIWWPRTATETVISGAAVLTAVADAGQALNEVTSASALADPVGELAIADIIESESTKILATYVGGVLDRDFDAVFSFTLNGAPRIARQKVMVRKR